MSAIESLISLTLLLGLMVAYNRYRVELLRDELFALRDAMYDDALDGKLSFESSAYGAGRAMFNGMIRFAHKISLLQFLCYSALVPRVANEAAISRFEAVEGSWQAGDREIVRGYLVMANRCVVRHLMRSPFFLVTVLLPVVLFAFTRAGIDVVAFVMGRFASSLKSLDSQALGEGQRLQSAAELATQC